MYPSLSRVLGDPWRSDRQTDRGVVQLTYDSLTKLFSELEFFELRYLIP